MDRALILRRTLAPWVLVVLSGCALAAVPSGWRSWDLGAFRLQTPPGLQQQGGAIDSQAGTLVGDGLRVEYDYGRYSDPLARSADRLDYRSETGIVDGLPARFVQYRFQGEGGGMRSCSGVHVPRVRVSGSNALSLTVLACADTSEQLAAVPTILSSIRFQAAPAR